MKVTKDQMAQNRARILSEAGRLFREKGFAAVTVSEVMKAAGLTHGGFYGHFRSKDDLVAQAILHASGSQEQTDDLATFIEAYLFMLHREQPGLGCPMAALAGLMGDQAPEARSAMAARLSEQIAALAQAMPGEDPGSQRQKAIGSFAAMAGAIILSRSIDDHELAKEILAAVRTWITQDTLIDKWNSQRRTRHDRL